MDKRFLRCKRVLIAMLVMVLCLGMAPVTTFAAEKNPSQKESLFEKAGKWLIETLGLNDGEEDQERATYLDATYINIQEIGAYIDAEAINTKIPTMELSKDYLVQPDEDVNHNMVWYSFTPSVSQYYTFSGKLKSTDKDDFVDSYGKLMILTKEGDQYQAIDRDDDSAGHNQFAITHKLDAGTTYYIWAGYYEKNIEKPYYVNVTETSMITKLQATEANPSRYPGRKNDINFRATYEDGSVNIINAADPYDSFYSFQMEFEDDAQEENWDNNVAGTYKIRYKLTHKYPDEEETVFAAQNLTVTLKKALVVTKIEPDREKVVQEYQTSLEDAVKAKLTYSDGSTATVSLDSRDEHGYYVSYSEEYLEDTDEWKCYLYVELEDDDLRSDLFNVEKKEAPRPEKVTFYYGDQKIDADKGITVLNPSVIWNLPSYEISSNISSNSKVEFAYEDGSTTTYSEYSIYDKYDQSYRYDITPVYNEEKDSYDQVTYTLSSVKWVSSEEEATEQLTTIETLTVPVAVEQAQLSFEAEGNSDTNRATFRADSWENMLNAVEFDAVFSIADETETVKYRLGESVTNPFNDEEYSIYWENNINESESTIGDHELTLYMYNYDCSGNIFEYTYYYTVEKDENPITLTGWGASINGTPQEGDMIKVVLTDSDNKQYSYYTKASDFNRDNSLIGDYAIEKTIDEEQEGAYQNGDPGLYNVSMVLTKCNSSTEKYDVVAGFYPITYQLYIPGEITLRDIQVETENNQPILVLTSGDGIGEDIVYRTGLNKEYGEDYGADNNYTCIEGYGYIKWERSIPEDEYTYNADDDYYYLQEGTHAITITYGKANYNYDEETCVTTVEYDGEPQTYNGEFTISYGGGEGEKESWISFDKSKVAGLQVGDKYTFKFESIDNPGDLPITWTLSDSTIATIDENTYQLTAQKAGTVTVTAALGDKSSTTCQVTITEKVVDEHTHTMTKVARLEPTCTTSGNKEYYICKGCNKLFSDINGNVETTLKAETLQATHKNITYVEYVEPTCIKDGIDDHYKCIDCGKIFFDKRAKNPATLAELAIAKTGHEFGEWTEEETTRYRTCYICEAKQTEKRESSTNDSAVNDIKGLVEQAKDEATPTKPAEVNVNIDSTQNADSKVEVTNEVLAAVKEANNKNVTVNLVIDNTNASNADERYAWEIDGSTVTSSAKAVNLEVKKSDIAQVTEDEKDVIARVKTATADSSLEEACQLSISHDGEFGFTASLKVYIGAGKAEQYAYLYWYEGSGSAEKVASAQIDSEGYAIFENMTHASEYFVLTSSDDVDVPSSVSCQHTNKTPVSAVAATCTKAGNKEYSKCTNCGDCFDANNKVVAEADLVVKATGHKLTYVAGKAATISANGNLAHYRCNTCKALFKDKAGKQATTAKAVTLARLASAKVGTSMKVGGITYKVTSNYVVSVQKVTIAKKVVIPATIKVKNVPYKVTALTTGAIASNKKVNTIVLGSNLTIINNSAFAKCKKLKTITIQSTGMTKATLKAKAFKGVTKSTKIQVPKSKKKAYTTLFRSKGLNKKVKIK